MPPHNFRLMLDTLFGVLTLLFYFGILSSGFICVSSLLSPVSSASLCTLLRQQWHVSNVPGRTTRQLSWDTVIRILKAQGLFKPPRKPGWQANPPLLSYLGIRLVLIFQLHCSHLKNSHISLGWVGGGGDGWKQQRQLRTGPELRKETGKYRKLVEEPDGAISKLYLSA